MLYEVITVMGGGMIYNQFFPLVSKLYLTIVHRDYEADTFFPEIDFNSWLEIEREDFSKGEKTDFVITSYSIHYTKLYDLTIT